MERAYGPPPPKRRKLNTCDNYKQAAEKIKECHFLLLATGAGWSADSGLPTYPGIAKVPAYERHKITYRMICQAGVLRYPPVFYGFWGDSTNMYRETAPHEGYSIIDRWNKNKEERMEHKKWQRDFKASLDFNVNGSESEIANWLQKKIVELSLLEKQSELIKFYDTAFSHWSQGQRETAVRKCTAIKFFIRFWQLVSMHDDTFIVALRNVGYTGRLEKQDISEFINFRTSKPIPVKHSPFFCLTSNVDAHFKKFFPPEQLCEIHGSVEEWQCAKHCGQSPWKLDPEFRFNVDKEAMTASPPYVRCPQCNELARPCILMFNDLDWQSPNDDEKLFCWIDSVRDLTFLNRKIKFTILEVGCGDNVPTVRHLV